MTPSDFNALDIKKKAHWLTLKYFNGDCFEHRRPTQGYFKVRSTFLKAKESDLTEMFLFLSGTDNRPALKELWHGCRQWNQEKLQKHPVSDYEPIDIKELL